MKASHLALAAGGGLLLWAIVQHAEAAPALPETDAGVPDFWTRLLGALNLAPAPAGIPGQGGARYVAPGGQPGGGGGLVGTVGTVAGTAGAAKTVLGAGKTVVGAVEKLIGAGTLLPAGGLGPLTASEWTATVGQLGPVSDVPDLMAGGLFPTPPPAPAVPVASTLPPTPPASLVDEAVTNLLTPAADVGVLGVEGAQAAITGSGGLTVAATGAEVSAAELAGMTGSELGAAIESGALVSGTGTGFLATLAPLGALALPLIPYYLFSTFGSGPAAAPPEAYAQRQADMRAFLAAGGDILDFPNPELGFNALGQARTQRQYDEWVRSEQAQSDTFNAATAAARATPLDETLLAGFFGTPIPASAPAPAPPSGDSFTAATAAAQAALPPPPTPPDPGSPEWAAYAAATWPPDTGGGGN